jgi:uncharacterized LabA/DUF88 family protein
MARFFPFSASGENRAMVFVDGENLSIRYGKMLEASKQTIPSHVTYEPNLFVWSVGLNNVCIKGGVLRKYYYTSVQGDEPRLIEIGDRLKSAGIEAPRVFKKNKDRGSKRVDISLATDMLLHASRKNYDVAVLVAGDEDYLPLVEAVKDEGRRVLLWFLEEGLSPILKRSADYYVNIGDVLFSPQIKDWR